MPNQVEWQQVANSELPAANGNGYSPAMVAGRKRLFQALLLAGDVLSGLLALAVADVVRFPGRSFLASLYTIAPGEALLAACWVLLLFLRQLYTLRPARPLLFWAEQLLVALLGGTLLGAAVTYFVVPQDLLPRSVYLGATLVALPLVGLVRALGVHLGPAELVRERVLLLGIGERAEALAVALSSGRSATQATLLGAVALPGETAADPPFTILGGLADCLALVRRHHVNHLVVTPLPPLTAEVVQCAARADVLGVHVASMETAYEELTGRAPVFHVGQTWEAGLETVHSSKYATRLKRLVDVIVTLLVMPLALVLMGVSALLIKLLTPGPVFYRQERVGRDGRVFSFIKLRTMVVDAEKETGPVWAKQDDPRVTPLGRFLRKTRLDELPQLFLVLRGDMSLIGPRPERPHFVQQFERSIPLYSKRLMVRPGITGWAQIHHNYDRSTDDVIEKLRYDLYYIRHLSLILDLQIILETLGVMLAHKGAQ